MDLFNYSRRESSEVNIGATPLGFVMSKNYGLTIFESMSVMPELLRDAEFRKYFITDVLGVWLFAAIGMGGYIWSLVKKGKTA